MSWKISKTFEFCYGHRVHTQVLLTEFALDTKCGCRALHGHNGSVTITLEGDVLNEEGMIFDYKGLGWFKKLLDEVLDHKFILDRNDPWMSCALHTSTNQPTTLVEHFLNGGIYWTVETNYEQLPICEREVLNGFIFVNFVPTSENIAKWLLDICNSKMKSVNVKVSSVTFQETPKTSAICLSV